MRRSRPAPSPSTARPTGAHAVAAALRPRLERARLELRALFRALDELGLAQELPDELHELLELDADFAEALYVLDRPPPRLNFALMVQDTEAALAALPEAQDGFVALLDRRTAAQLAARAARVQARLRPEDAYLLIPGRDPAAGC